MFIALPLSINLKTKFIFFILLVPCWTQATLLYIAIFSPTATRGISTAAQQSGTARKNWKSKGLYHINNPVPQS